MFVIDGEYFENEVSKEDVRWAMGLACASLQGAANAQDFESYCNKVAQMTMHILGTEKMIHDELDL